MKSGPEAVSAVAPHKACAQQVLGSVHGQPNSLQAAIDYRCMPHAPRLCYLQTLIPEAVHVQLGLLTENGCHFATAGE
jgi:hypothetical protein